MLLAAVPSIAQQAPAEGAEGLVVQVFTLEHQPAGEAMALVLPLLSRRGTVELRPGGNTLVIRDSLAALARIVPVLRSFDHPARPVEVDLWLVRARPAQVSPPSHSPDIPTELLARLEAYLPYGDYELVSSSTVSSREGQELRFQLAQGYEVQFRLGTILVDQRLRLHQFEISQRQPEPGGRRSLMRSNLNLWLGRTTILALTPGGDSREALLVVVRCHGATAAGAGD